MRTQKQIEASRANGKKSRGPKTEEGKRRSSRNSLVHGVFSHVLIMTSENPDEYADLRRGYFTRFQPADTVEADIVGNMVASQWFLRRSWKAETALLDVTMDLMEPKIDAKFDRVDRDVRSALAYKKLSDRSTSLANVQRQADRLQRAYHRALNELCLVRTHPSLNPPPNPAYQDLLEPPDPTAPNGPELAVKNEPGDLQLSQPQQVVNEPQPPSTREEPGASLSRLASFLVCLILLPLLSWFRVGRPDDLGFGAVTSARSQSRQEYLQLYFHPIPPADSRLETASMRSLRTVWIQGAANWKPIDRKGLRPSTACRRRQGIAAG